jgi:DNA topoisomerase-3
VILSLTESGAVTDIPVPESTPRFTKSKRKPTDGTRPRKRPTKRAGTEAATTPSAGLGNCPLCGAEEQEQPKSYSCSGWKAGCKFAIWKTIARKKISSSMARTLLTKGQTSRLKGFKSKAGKAFDARLKLVDGKLQFDFSQ